MSVTINGAREITEYTKQIFGAGLDQHLIVRRRGSGWRWSWGRLRSRRDFSTQREAEKDAIRKICDYIDEYGTQIGIDVFPKVEVKV